MAKITAITAQTRNPNRVNIFVDGKYLFSFDISQIIDLGMKVGQDYSEDEIKTLKSESDFGKLYARTLEYCLLRPRSSKEMRDYLYKKTLPRLNRVGKKVDGASNLLTEKVYKKLLAKKYIDDEKFAIYWVENRMQKRGISARKLTYELFKKGVDDKVIEKVIENSGRNNLEEIKKVIYRKRSKYQDKKKLIAFLFRQGFDYSEINEAIDNVDG